jgi:ankyrin repeat protein
MEISQYRVPGYSQGTTKISPGLCAAAYFSLIETAKLLLEKGANIEAKTSDGRTALYVAASNKHDAVVKLLLERGANIEVEDQNGETPLYIAYANGHTGVVKLLEASV